MAGSQEMSKDNFNEFLSSLFLTRTVQFEKLIVIKPSLTNLYSRQLKIL